jgi:hypothetical protein
MIGGFHVGNSTYRAGAVVAGGSAELAVQQIMGLLPQRRTWFGARGLTCAGSGGTVVRLADLDQFSRSRCLRDLPNGRSIRSCHA